MRVLAFRHVPFEGLGLIEPVLRARRIDVEYADLYQPGAALPDIAAYDALIFLGGPMSVNDDLPYLRREMELHPAGDGARQPVLGICLGAQLIAKALGATVQRNPAKEIGWYDLHFTEAARGRPALSRALARRPCSTGTARPSTCRPAPNCWRRRSSAAIRRSASANDVYGLQFHLEVTPEMIADWCVQDENCGDVRELESAIDPYFNAPRLAELSGTVFGRWCEMLQSREDDSLPILPYLRY